MKTLDQLVEEFAINIAAQTEAIMAGDARVGNRHAKKYIRAWDQLRTKGDEGRDALSHLFTHHRPDVRVSAAACLLKHRTEEAKLVLQEAAKNCSGLVSFEASQALQRWEEHAGDGHWGLDPD